MAASGRMQYDYKQTNGIFFVGASRGKKPYDKLVKTID